MWYQANDGGQRRWLTEPFIRPAESNANVRGVMNILGVPGAVGLGIQSAMKKELPFKVISILRDSGSPHDDGSSFGTRRWRRLYDWSLETASKTKDILQAWVSAPLKVILSGIRASHLPDGMPSKPLTPYDYETSSWIARMAQPHLSLASSTHISPLTVLASITSTSRFVEHLL